MFNIAGRRIPCVLAIVPFNAFDVPKKGDHTSRSFYLEANQNETGWDRLYNMFSIDEFGNKSPEMNFVLQGTFSGIIGGVIWGGIAKSKDEYFNFLRKNDATKFGSVFEAQRKLQDTVMLNFARGAFQWGWRLGLFTGSYILITTSIAAYRGRSSVIEYAAAGFITGSCYKFSLGPRAMVVGGALGGVLGSVAGLISLGILRLTGTTMEEIRFWQYNWKRSRDENIQAAIKKSRSPDTAMEKLHDMARKGKEPTELIPDVVTESETK